MDDKTVLSRINGLVDEEHTLREQLRRGEISGDAERARLNELEVSLDQCWDLLRRRRALSEYGEDPSEAKVRPADEVEGYLS
jgi:hypothetical protein